jgi:tungstate transport system substrate-binding protein
MKYYKRIFLLGFILFLNVCFLNFNAFAKQSLMMATTTSTDNTGLLDYLIPEFTKDTGIELRWTAVGTGKALRLGQNCDVDMLMVHAPSAEKEYIDQGYGFNRREIMYNDFVLIGPGNDPAGIKGKTITSALTAIKNKKAVFVSRGDNSGTNKKEILLWKKTGLQISDKAPSYVQTGQGMLATINIATERNGYTLTDRGTYIVYQANMKKNSGLKILVQGDTVLMNQYSVITVHPWRCKNLKTSLAKKFSDWITQPKAQKLIKNFKLLGKQLFTPNAK